MITRDEGSSLALRGLSRTHGRYSAPRSRVAPQLEYLSMEQGIPLTPASDLSMP